MRASIIKGLFGKTSDIWMEVMYQGEQFPIEIFFFDHDGIAKNLSQYAIVVRFRKAVAKVNLKSDPPTISNIKWDDSEAGNGMLGVQEVDYSKGTFLVRVPDSFHDDPIAWDNPVMTTCALLEFQYSDHGTDDTRRKHVVWIVILPSLEHS